MYGGVYPSRIRIFLNIHSTQNPPGSLPTSCGLLHVCPGNTTGLIHILLFLVHLNFHFTTSRSIVCSAFLILIPLVSRLFLSLPCAFCDLNVFNFFLSPPSYFLSHFLSFHPGVTASLFRCVLRFFLRFISI